jgi:hypothetical protein
MNPTLEENIMRKRVHRSAIMLATALACLLVTPDRASAQVTFIVPVDVTNLHENVTGVMVLFSLFQGGSVSNQSDIVPVVDGSVQEDVEVTGDWFYQGVTIAHTFHQFQIRLRLISSDGQCTANRDYTIGNVANNPDWDHCRQGWHILQTYAEATVNSTTGASLTAPRADLIPE